MTALSGSHLRLSKKSGLSLRDPERVVAISQNCFGILINFGEFETFHTRFPRRFAPTGKRRARIRKAPLSPTATASE